MCRGNSIITRGCQKKVRRVAGGTEELYHCDLDTGQPDWTVRRTANTVRVVPARAMQLLDRGDIVRSFIFCINMFLKAYSCVYLNILLYILCSSSINQSGLQSVPHNSLLSQITQINQELFFYSETKKTEKQEDDINLICSRCCYKAKCNTIQYLANQLKCEITL